MVHTVKHSSEELILSKDLFSHLQPGEYVQLLDPYRPSLRLILRVPALQTAGGTLEVSLSKTVAEPLDLKPFSRIHIERVAPEEAEVDFVELTFRRQFLQRGYSILPTFEMSTSITLLQLVTTFRLVSIGKQLYSFKIHLF